MTAGRPPARLLAEAGLAIMASSAAIRLLPFKRLAQRMKGSGGGNPGDPVELRAIRRSIEAWARRLPWRTLCFEQGLAAHWMLRRRGLASTLYYGAAPDPCGGALRAHVWVRSAGEDVIGCEQAGGFAVLSRY